MALIKCPECGKMFSDKAKCCPGCGCPVEKALEGNEKSDESNNQSHEDDNKKCDSDIVSNHVRNVIGTIIVLIVLLKCCPLYDDVTSSQSKDFEKSEKTVSNSTTVRDTATISYGIVGDEFQDNSQENIEACMAILNKWNEGLRNHDLYALSSLYVDVTNYYGSNCTRDDIRSEQASIINKYPDFDQYIDNIVPEPWNDWYTIIHFDKHVRTSKNGEYKTYPSYLCFIGTSISRESDEITDKNVERREKKMARIKFDNTTPLNKIFCESNVGKYIDYISCRELVGLDDKDEKDVVFGPLASVLRSDENDSGGYWFNVAIWGELKKNYRGMPNTYYCNGGEYAGGSTTKCIWLYNTTDGTLTGIWE
jgi:hypothetical protein